MSSKNLTRLARRLSAITGWSHQRSLQALSAVKAQLPPSTDKEAAAAFLQNLAKGTLTSSAIHKSFQIRDLDPVERLQLLVTMETLVEPDDYLLSFDHEKGEVRKELDALLFGGMNLVEFFKANPNTLITWSRRNHRWALRANRLNRSGFIPGTVAYSIIFNYLLSNDVTLTAKNSLNAVLLDALFKTEDGKLRSADTYLHSRDVSEAFHHTGLGFPEIQSYFNQAERKGYFDEPDRPVGSGLPRINVGKLAQLINDYHYPFNLRSTYKEVPFTERPDYISPEEEAEEKSLEEQLQLPSRAKGFERYKDYYRQRAQDLVGESRALGNWGPAYEITAILHETDEDIILDCVLPPSGEHFEYSLSEALRDPPAIHRVVSYRITDGNMLVKEGTDTLYATSKRSAQAAVKAMLKQLTQYKPNMEIQTSTVIKPASHKGSLGTSTLSDIWPTDVDDTPQDLPQYPSPEE